MSKVNLDHIKKTIELLEQKVFPAYAESLSAQQGEILNFLNQQNLTKDQIIAGVVQGMSHSSFQLAVKLSFLLASALNDPDFDFENPQDLQEITNMFFEQPVKSKTNIVSLN